MRCDALRQAAPRACPKLRSQPLTCRFVIYGLRNDPPVARLIYLMLTKSSWTGWCCAPDPTQPRDSGLFLTFAAGSILCVVVQLIGPAAFAASNTAVLGVLAGLAVGFVTDLVVTAGGVLDSA